MTAARTAAPRLSAEIAGFVIDPPETSAGRETYAVYEPDGTGVKRILGRCSGKQAARQWVGKALATYLNCREIYTLREGMEYGCELPDLVGGDKDKALAEIRPMVTECLARDARFAGLSDFSIKDGPDGNTLVFSFTVSVTDGSAVDYSQAMSI